MELEAIVIAATDRQDIQDVICAVTLHADQGEAAQALACYTDDAQIDYGSLSGPAAGNVSVKEHRAKLSGWVPGFDCGHHQITNFEIRINGVTATARSQVAAMHAIGLEKWLVYGTYHHRLEKTPTGWKISYQRFQLAYQEGEHLISKAAAIVTARNSART